MRYTFQYAEVLELKKACAEHFPDHVHFHDGCGGQYFSLDEENDALCGFIAGYKEAPACGGGFFYGNFAQSAVKVCFFY